MALAPGTKLGPYEILSQIGAGGMGEVYKARDTRLDRFVAIKVLPAHLADSPELRERFEREARTIAKLNHPHICTLHDVGQQDGTDFLVMEYLEGETLAERLKKGPLPLEQVLRYAVEVSDALDKAHRAGVTHRDIKPGNVIVTKEGTKLLDFGLAKLKQEVAKATIPASEMPTVPGALTEHGTLLGTLHYMAPEQVEGKINEIDARTDIFAFGALVYEMGTGKRAFPGETQASVIAKILEVDPPPMSELQPMTPPSLGRVVKRCLAKEPEKRWQSANDLCDELKWITESGSEVGAATAAAAISARSGWRRVIPLVLTAVMAIIITGLAVWNLRPVPASQPVSRMAMVLPPDQTLFYGGRHQVAFSPDGKNLVYVANQQLYLRAMDRLEATPIRGTEEGGGRSPFFSPDGQWVGFWAGGNLKKVSISGGAPVILCEAGNPYGASWGADDRILFGQGLEGIFHVSAAGGSKELLISVDAAKGESAHGPHLLPGEEAVLFTLSSGGSWDEAQIVVEQLETGERKVLINGGTDARYVPTGHLVYAREGTLLAAPFDLARLEVTGNAVPIAEGVTQSGSDFTGAAHFSFSQLGSLVYVPGITREISNTLLWVDREGTEERLAADRLHYLPSLSPDGAHVALSVSDATQDDVWIYDLARKTFTRLTFDPADDSHPIWTPDGLRVVFASDRDGGRENLYWKAADGTGQVERLTTSPNFQWPASFSPDGKGLVFSAFVGDGSSANLYVLSMEGEPAEQPLLRTQFNEENPAISPDGRWIAYDSNESGRNEIFVRPFPNVEEGKWQISSDEGKEPVWGPQGRELFYRSGDAMKVVSIQAEPTFTAGSSEILFAGGYDDEFVGRDYDISLDGERFLMTLEFEQTDDLSARTELIIVHNWFEELKQRVPSGQ